MDGFYISHALQAQQAKAFNKKTIEDYSSMVLKHYTNSITTISAASPRRGPTFKIRVYPPLRSA
jgi:hypothetical protein